ncbi:ribosomal-processing cysteine protease Prp [Spiroplasma endosymbiont of Poecilobothrus nobilitatus]|uniref:ribosomal-processing cysteine protease Prp n=1 Tax=Spiroplasma endosymbiont of Poecilobothrus nobilitatus TaxID=1209220 RepID=UPI00313F1149
MIKIIITKTEQKIKKIEITGHAKAAEYGKDLVCAAITGIATGGLNSIDQIKPNSCQFIVKEGLIIITVKNNSADLQVVLQTIYYQFLTIYQQYQKFISVKEVEE